MAEAEIPQEKYVAIDVETSALIDFKLPADDPAQGRIASFALVELDDKLEPCSVRHRYVRPDGWSMTEGASRVNGLADEMLRDNGTPIDQVLDIYENAVSNGWVVVSFNAQFDCKALRGEFRRAGRDDLFEITRNICTMRPLVKVLNLKQENSNRPKWPSLKEACDHFGIPLLQPHDAVCDALAVGRLFKEMMARDLCPEARVHRAKVYPLPQRT